MSNSARRAGAFLQLAFIPLLVLFAMPAWSQEASSADMVPRRMVVTFATEPAAAFTPNELFMASRSLILRLQQATTEITAEESTGQETSASGADSTLEVTLSGSWPALSVRAVSKDLISNTAVLDTSFKREGWTSSDGLADEDWNEIVKPLAGSYHKIAAAATTGTGAKLAQLTVRALPGTLLIGPEGSRRTVGSTGMATWEVPVAKQYSLRSRLLTYQPLRMDFFLAGDREIDLQQKKESVLAFDASLMNFSTPRFDLSGSLDPGRMFFRFGLSTSLVAIDIGSGGLFRSDPLQSLSLQLGVYLTPADSYGRLYWGIGAFARIVTSGATAPSFDQLAPWGQTMILGAEIFPSADGTLFFEWSPTFYTSNVPDLFRAALGSGNAPPGWVFGTGTIAELLAFRIGYRWNL